MTSIEPDEPVEAQAPPVVVAMVTRDAGPWLEDALAALGAQDYPNLSVLVLASGETSEMLARVAAVLPSAFVRRIDGDPGYGPAANEVLQVVEGAAFYAFCHDDVVLEPNAIRVLVEEAYRSNAGIVGPKLVEWHAPDRLLHVGLSVDKSGTLAPLVERGELDQEQHDAVRDVFVIPGACMLVRADLFSTLGGFDPAITLLGEDLDLCWRAQVAGARVVIVPAARAQHRESMRSRPPAGAGELLTRHRLRTVLTCYGAFHLVRVLPQVLVLAVAETIYAVASGRRQRAKQTIAAWSWNLRNLADLRARRRQLRSIRQLPDSEVRRLQQGGSVRVRSYFRGELHAGARIRASLAGISREMADVSARTSRNVVISAWMLVALLFVLGTRGLLFQRLPAVGGLATFDEGVLDLLRTYVSGWRHVGLGGEAPQPTALALLGLAGIPLLGGMGLLQQLLVLGAIPVGIAGSWRLTRPLGSRVGRSAAMIVYAILPMPYDALARGSWGGLLVYAAAPWVLTRLVAACGDLPSAHGPVVRRRDLPAIAALGLLVALVAAFVPLIVLLVPLVAAALVLGAMLTGGARRAAGAVTVAVGASVLALLVHVPWTFDFFLPGSEWWATGGVSPLVHDAVGIGSLVRFETGPRGVSTLGWALPVAAALPLIIGRDWRFAWAVRCWCVALVCWAVAWAGGQGLLGLAVPSADVLLPPAAAALSLSVALGVASFERDLRGYHFGWRQVAALVAAASVVVAVVPVALATIDGRWDLPRDDHAASLSFLRRDDVRQGGAFRVLWLGHPETLPVAPFRLVDDLGYGISDNGTGALGERWAAPAYGATPLVAEALRLAASGDTERLGRMLGPLGIRFVILADRAAPARGRTERHALPGGLVATMSRQLDLRRIQVDPALRLYENASWVPVRAHVQSAEALRSANALRTAAATDLAAVTEPVLTRRTGHATYEGEVPAGTVYVAQATSSRWQLRVDGESADRERAMGWANAFDVNRAGAATLRYRTSPVRWLAVLLQVALWAITIAMVVVPRRRRRREGGR